MFIEIHIEDLKDPQIVAIEKAGRLAEQLEKRGKRFRLGKIC
jgi:ribosomal protein S3